MKKVLIIFTINLLAVSALFAQTQDKEEIIYYNESGWAASFPGGDKAFAKFLDANLRYPSKAKKEGKEGTVYVRFIVDKDGSIMKDCVSITRSIDPFLDEEAVRLVKMFPKWNPGMRNMGTIPAKSRIRVPMKFKLPTKK